MGRTSIFEGFRRIRTGQKNGVNAAAGRPHALAFAVPLLWLACAGGLPTRATAAGTNKYAVCVGINKYASQLQAGTLSGCVNDAAYFYTNLAVRGGWPTANMTKLTDSRATKDAIRRAVSNYAAKAVAGDTFVYQHSSHGGRNYPDYSSDKRSVFLLAYDNYYEDTEMAADLRSFAAGVKVIVVVDACHSGGLFMGGSGRARARKAAEEFDLAARVTALMEADRQRRQARGENVAKSLSAGEIGWVTAANYTESSLDYGFYDTDDWLTDPDAEGKVRAGTFLGAFTWGWWDGSADSRSGYGDNDGYADAYECWKRGHDFCTNIDLFWGFDPSDEDYPYAYVPQCTNVSVLRSVELGWSGSTTPSATVALPTALDNSALSFATGGSGDWFGQTGTSHDGTNAAQSGTITHSQSTWLETTVSGPGTLDFWWNTSSETNCDRLSVLVDGTTNAAISGNGRSWVRKSLEIASGSHTVRWVYSKNASRNVGSDCGWVDQVAWTPSGQPNLSFYTLSGRPSAAYLATTQGGTNSATVFETGAPVYVTFSYDNSGTVAAGPHMVHVLVQNAAGETVEEWGHSCTNSFGTDEAILRSAPIEVAMPAGAYAVTITLDSTGAVAESDETDNVFTLAFTVSEPVRTQTVVFDANGGSPATQTRTYTLGGTYGSFPEVTRSGHAFDGWFTAATNGTRVLPGSEVTAEAMRTLYAHWTPEGGGNVQQFSFGTEGGTQTLVLSGGRSTSQSNPLAWVDSGLRIALSGGSYVTTLTVSCAANNGSKRMGNLTVTVDGTTYTVTVVQDGDFGVSEFATDPEAGLSRITWVGEAGRRYAVQRAPSPDGPWTTAGTVMASADGLVSLEAAMPGQWSQGFYRLGKEE